MMAFLNFLQPRPVRIAAQVCVAAMSLLPLEGCSSHKPPGTLPSLSPSLTSTESRPGPQRSPTLLPTSQSASAFARTFYKAVEMGFSQRDPALVAKISLPTCKVCNRYIASIVTLRDEKQVVRGHLAFKIALAEAPATDGRTARVDVIWSTTAVRRYSATGTLLLNQKPLIGIQETMLLKFRAGHWFVGELT